MLFYKIPEEKIKKTGFKTRPALTVFNWWALTGSNR